MSKAIQQLGAVRPLCLGSTTIGNPFQKILGMSLLKVGRTFGGIDWFGSINVIFVGDLLQLSPVNGDPVFSKLNHKATSKLGCMGSGNIWKDTVTYDELTINEQQKVTHYIPRFKMKSVGGVLQNKA